MNVREKFEASFQFGDLAYYNPVTNCYRANGSHNRDLAREIQCKWEGYQAASAESAAENTRLRTDNYELLSKLTTAEMKIAELEKDRDEWKDATISANTRFKIAEDRVAELEKDKELLDWFNREKPCVHHVYDSGGFNFGLDVSTDVEENIFHSSDIRDAIRQAITNTGDTNEPD